MNVNPYPPSSGAQIQALQLPVGLAQSNLVQRSLDLPPGSNTLPPINGLSMQNNSYYIQGGSLSGSVSGSMPQTPITPLTPAMASTASDPTAFSPHALHEYQHDGLDAPRSRLEPLDLASYSGQQIAATTQFNELRNPPDQLQPSGIETFHQQQSTGIEDDLRNLVPASQSFRQPSMYTYAPPSSTHATSQAFGRLTLDDHNNVLATAPVQYLPQYAHLPLSFLNPEPVQPEPTHVVGQQGRRGVLPTAPNRPPPLIGAKFPVPPKNADGKFPCPHCAKTYLHAKHLKRHMLRHTGHRPYSCNLCNDTFSRSDILKRHFQKCSIRRGAPPGTDHLEGSRAHSQRHRHSTGSMAEQRNSHLQSAGPSHGSGAQIDGDGPFERDDAETSLNYSNRSSRSTTLNGESSNGTSLEHTTLHNYHANFAPAVPVGPMAYYQQ